MWFTWSFSRMCWIMDSTPFCFPEEVVNWPSDFVTIT